MENQNNNNNNNNNQLVLVSMAVFLSSSLFWCHDCFLIQVVVQSVCDGNILKVVGRHAIGL